MKMPILVLVLLPLAFVSVVSVNHTGWPFSYYTDPSNPRVIILEAYATDGLLRVPWLYGNGTTFLGAGEHDRRRWVAGPLDRCVASETAGAAGRKSDYGIKRALCLRASVFTSQKTDNFEHDYQHQDKALAAAAGLRQLPAPPSADQRQAAWRQTIQEQMRNVTRRQDRANAQREAGELNTKFGESPNHESDEQNTMEESSMMRVDGRL